MNRRGFLTKAGAVAGVAATFPAPAIAQGARELKLVTSWPKGFPGVGTSAERLGSAITASTGGRLKVQVFGAGQLV
ncbi:MAG: twin-arginine translocation signal domain-containing protein, partial [Hyphomicrobiales bacterium]|nr:twin-arginine translocation signal domain-containing protein [Hyphomicrobiales bacterium]